MNDSKRIEYIDAMRGFTMLLVVANHIAGHCLGIGDDVPSIHPILHEFRMPLFFFISGFVLYKEDTIWDASYVVRFLVVKKFPVQIITTTIFFLVFLKMNHIGVVDGLYNEQKCGYWFTYGLFLFFCIYSALRYVLGLFKCKGICIDIIILSVGSLLFLLFYIPSVLDKLPTDESIKNLLSMKKWGYFLFFAIGTIFKKHFDKFQEILDNTSVLMICLITFFGLNVYYVELRASHFSSLELTTAITGIIIVFSFFRIHQNLFKKDKIVGRCLQYVGRRTLDVYLLHYLLIPFNLKEHFSFLVETPVPIIEFTITLFVTLIVVAGCLLISKILRMSSTLAYLLFGVRKR